MQPFKYQIVPETVLQTVPQTVPQPIRQSMPQVMIPSYQPMQSSDVINHPTSVYGQPTTHVPTYQSPFTYITPQSHTMTPITQRVYQTKYLMSAPTTSTQIPIIRDPNQNIQIITPTTHNPNTFTQPTYNPTATTHNPTPTTHNPTPTTHNPTPIIHNPTQPTYNQSINAVQPSTTHTDQTTATPTMSQTNSNGIDLNPSNSNVPESTSPYPHNQEERCELHPFAGIYIAYKNINNIDKFHYQSILNGQFKNFELKYLHTKIEMETYKDFKAFDRLSIEAMMDALNIPKQQGHRGRHNFIGVLNAFIRQVLKYNQSINEKDENNKENIEQKVIKQKVIKREKKDIKSRKRLRNEDSSESEYNLSSSDQDTLSIDENTEEEAKKELKKYIHKIGKKPYSKREVTKTTWTRYCTNKNITQYIQPQARCCNFEQQYNDKFKCRYFKSDVDRINNQQSTERAAEDSNETTYTTCPDKFPLLLSCNTILNEQNRITAYAQTNNDIQFYGSFYAHSANSDGEYNPDNNLYFELNTGINSSKSIPFPPTSTTTSTSRIIGSTPSPTYTPTSSGSILQLNISSSTHCVSQYGPIKGNYTISSIATCCTESYDTSSSDILQPTSSPTTSPTMRSPLETQLIGTNGTNTGEFYIENKASDSIIIGINTWGIYQVIDTNTINGTQYKIYYQGILIGSYLTMDANGIIETKFTSSDFAAETNNFYTITSCAGFILDIDNNGNRDFINGYDVYYTHIAIYGITFYTSFGRQYSCPDHQEFKDTSLQFANSELCDGKGNGCGQTIAETYYDIIKISERNIFAINGTYKLSGWKGWLQTRTLGPGVIRSIYGSIHFLFIGNATLNTLSPTISPTPTPTNNKIKTLSPTFAGQETSESLKCY
eukprot:383896_1